MHFDKLECLILFVLFFVIGANSLSIIQNSKSETKSVENKDYYLHNYFQKVLEPIRYRTFNEGSVRSTVNYSYVQNTTESHLPKYIYSSSNPSLETSTIQNERVKRIQLDSFKPKMIPLNQNMRSSIASRSSRLFDGNEEDSFKPIPNPAAAYSEDRSMKTHTINLVGKKVKSIIESPTTTTVTVQTSASDSSSDRSRSSKKTESKLLSGEPRQKIKKKYQKYMLPLLLAYKLKFFTLIPLMMGGLVLLTGATGMAGFFFALFASVIGLRSGSSSS